MQATGHGGVVPVDGVLLVTARLQDVCVDREERTAWVAAGLHVGRRRRRHPGPRSGAARRLVAHRRRGRLGARRRARLAGPPLRPGVRHRALVRGRHARTARCVRTCRDENRELFRALRGGGGSSRRGHRHGDRAGAGRRRCTAATSTTRAERAAEVVARYAEWVADAPDELTSSVVSTNRTVAGGDRPRLLERRPRRRSGAHRRVAGRHAAGDRRVGRDVRSPTSRRSATTPSIRCPASSTGGVARPARRRGRRGARRRHVRWRQRLAVFAEVRHAGGAVAAGDRAESTMGNRDCPFLLHLVGVAGDDNRSRRCAGTSGRSRRRLDRLASGPTSTSSRATNAATARARRSIQPTSPRSPPSVASSIPDDLLRFGVEHA